jgi:acetyltransferase-like isoleucine patch superfamily enzyme
MAPQEKQYVKIAPVTIEEYAFIGLNCTILPGVTIGKASVIGAGSVLINTIPPYSIAVGSPAKVIKSRPMG